MPTQLRPYQGAYRHELEEPVHSPNEPGSHDTDTSNDDPVSPAEEVWKKRYGDLRSHTNKQQEQIKALTEQVKSLSQKEMRFPSSRDEIEAFAAKNPDVFRHIRSIAMAELLQQKQDLTESTQKVQEDLNKLTMEVGYKKITLAHPDFDAINQSPDFHEWVKTQPQHVQDWVYDDPNPDHCIRALDFYKLERDFAKKQAEKPKPERADLAVRTRSPVEMTDTSGKKIWKASEIAALNGKQWDKFEDEIMLAREEGRIDVNA